MAGRYLWVSRFVRTFNGQERRFYRTFARPIESIDNNPLATMSAVTTNRRSNLSADLDSPSQPIQVNWSPGPTWLLRRDRIRNCLGKMPRGRLLEIGCGAGAMLTDFAAMQFDCHAVETSPVAARAARQRTADFANVEVHEAADESWSQAFDYVLAFEVLEHVEFDAAAVAQWVSWLKPGGHFLMSVPAHAKRWNASDQWAGHFRRYERQQLESLLTEAGLAIVTHECYGFPLSNLVQPLRARVHKKQLENGAPDQDDRQLGTDRSGVERTGQPRADRLLNSVPGRISVGLFCQLQRAFLNTELGNNYFVCAQKQ
jgi:2-polyprenyl-3-methyl-5-hydroxy-6-metoxy-1,4-benzoquinol methylase